MTNPTGRIEIEVVPDLNQFPGKLSSGLRGVSGLAGSIGKGLGVAVAAGTAVAAVGLKQVITLGNEYQGNLNEIQAVSGATADQMRRVGDTAKALGGDLTLPATSAADAAAAMVELAKGGLSVDEAMKAAKGTLQLAAAAQTDGATAAEIQSSALNAFGLAAGQASRVADVLANTSNAAAGSIIDVGYSLKYVAPVAAALKISIEDTASAIGLLANQGVKGEQAGTSLRGILASLSSPSKEAKKAMDALGLSVFDAQGKFVGLRVFTDQLAKAKGRLTDQQFAAAASTAFGNEGLTAANALAAEGTKGFDEMAKAVARQGGAAEVAAARTKGLGGALEGFQSQVETLQIGIYEAIAPSLDKAVRAASEGLTRLTPTVVSGIQTAVDVGTTFGPKLAAALQSKAGDLANVGRKLVEPLARGLVDVANGGVNVAITAVKGFSDVARNAVDTVTPLARGVGELVGSLSNAGGPIGAAGAALGIMYDAASGLVNILSPVVDVATALVGAATDLPGPIQTAAIALLALRFGPSLLGSLRNAFTGVRTEADGAAKSTGLLGRAFSTVTAPVRLVAGGLSSVASTVRQFNDEARVAQSLGGLRDHITNIGAGAATAGPAVGKLAGYTAAFNTSTIPAVAAARSFRDQTVAIRDAAAGAGQPMSAFGAAIGTVVERSSGLSAVAASFTRASTAVDGTGSAFGRLAAVAAGTTAAVGTGLVRAASGLVGALGGPFGIAIAGASIGLGLLADHQAKAAQSAAEHQRRIAQVADTLDRQTGAATKATRELKAKELAESGLFATASKLAISQSDLVDAFTGQAPAIESVNLALRSNAKQFASSSGIVQEYVRLFADSPGFLDLFTEATLGNESALKKLQEQYPENAQVLSLLVEEVSKADPKYRALAQALGISNDELGVAAQNTKDVAAAQGTAKGPLNDFAAAMGKVSSSTATAQDRANGLREAMRALTGGVQDARDAQATFYGAIDGLAERLGNATGKLTVTNGQFDVTSEKGRQLNETLKTMQTGFTDYAAAQSQAGKSSAEIATGLGAMRDAAINALEPIAGTRAEAIKLVDSMGLFPQDVSIQVNTPGIGPATEAAKLLGGSLLAIKDKSVTVKALTAEAEKSLLALGFKIEKMEDGTVRITADDEAAMSQLQNLLAVVNSSTGTAKIAGDPQPAYDATGRLIQHIDRSKGTVTGDANLAPAYNSAGQFIGFVNRSYATTTGRADFKPAYDATGQVIGYINTRTGTINVGANTSAAREAIDGFIGAYGSKQIRIGVAVNARAVGAMATGGILAAYANGGIASAKGFAAGGLAQQLTPMRGGYADIVPPNTWRVIGDRLRDREAYIPIVPGSSRSEGVLAQTAREMGFALTRLYANGGVASTTAAGSRTGSTRPGGVVVENLTLNALDDRFRLSQVEETLKYAGIH